MIEHLKKKTVKEYTHLSDDFKLMINICSLLAEALFNDNLVITSIYRNPPDPPKKPGVHSFYRGVDVRILKNGGEKGTYRLAEIMNCIYMYNFNAPHLQVAVTDLYHGTAPHLHLQIHPNTHFLTPGKSKEIEEILKVQRENFKPIKLT